MYPLTNLIIVLVATSLLSSCQKNTQTFAQNTQETTPISCTDTSCNGAYTGPEFINRSDIAHQFSNSMSKVVGEKLKAFYASGTYKKVDFKAITMTTEGMGSGTVTYYLSIPFMDVKNACDAYTSFDHVGGWNHTPALEARKKQLSGLLLAGEQLDISDLKTTPEGLEEYWIQWKHKKVQGDCEQ